MGTKVPNFYRRHKIIGFFPRNRITNRYTYTDIGFTRGAMPAQCQVSSQHVGTNKHFYPYCLHNRAKS